MKIDLIYIHYLRAATHVALYFLANTGNKVQESVFKTKALQNNRAICFGDYILHGAECFCAPISYEYDFL